MNIRILINIFLSFSSKADFHIDMTKIVNSSFEYWQSNSWDLSIRTCFNNFVKYVDEISIFSFDIMQYFCHDLQCETFHFIHCGQIIFFDRDRQSKFQTNEIFFFKIRALIFNNAQINEISDFYRQIFNKYLMIKKNSVQKILISNVIIQRLDVVFSQNKISVIWFVINHIFNTVDKKLKSSNLINSIRKKLKFKIFEKNHLIHMLN